MKLNQVARINGLLAEIKALKTGLAESIRGLPHNSTAKPFGDSGLCFVVNFSEITMHDNWSAGYYHFQRQYDVLSEYVERAQSENYVKRLVRVLDSEVVEAYLGCSRLQRVRLHPQVIANVKTLLAGRSHTFTMIRKSRPVQTFTGSVA